MNTMRDIERMPNKGACFARLAVSLSYSWHRSPDYLEDTALLRRLSLPLNPRVRGRHAWSFVASISASGEPPRTGKTRGEFEAGEVPER